MKINIIIIYPNYKIKKNIHSLLTSVVTGWFHEAVGDAQTGASDFLAFFWGVGERGSAFSFPHATVSLVSYKIKLWNLYTLWKL